MKRLALILLVCVFTAAANAQPVNGIILNASSPYVIKVWGTHYERGYAQGYLLADQIEEIYTGYVIPMFGSYLPFVKIMIQQGEALNIPAEYISEAQGVLDGMTDAGVNTTGLDYLDLLVGNTFLDISNMASLKNIMKPGCSSLMSWGDATTGTPLNGKSVITRHLDWSTNAAIVNNQAIIVHFPSEADEQPWIMIGFTGQIGILSGVSSQGLCVFQHQMSDSYTQGLNDAGYEPIWFSLRKMIEKTDYNGDGANDTRDMMAILSNHPAGYADGFIVTALSPSTSGHDSLIAMVAEVAPSAPYHVFRYNDYNDSIPGDNLYAANYEIKRNFANHYCTRYYNVSDALYLSNGEDISADSSWSVMRDYSNAGAGNLQMIQVIPEDLQLYVSFYKGGNPAYLGNPMFFPLDELFEFPTGYEPVLNSGICVMPNPVNGSFRIHANAFFGNGTIEICDLNGRQLMRLNDWTPDKEMNIDILNPGLYLLKLSDRDGSSGYARIVKL